jgi:hypothetical protein
VGPIDKPVDTTVMDGKDNQLRDNHRVFRTDHCSIPSCSLHFNPVFLICLFTYQIDTLIKRYNTLMDKAAWWPKKTIFEGEIIKK